MIHPKTTIFFLLVIIAILCVLLIRGCKEVAPIQGTLTRVDTLKVTATKIKDSIIVKTVYRTKILTHWDTIRHDSLIPCEIKLLVCDTVIQADSSLIEAQRLLIGVQDGIIKGQDTIITDLRKSNKKFWRGFKWGFVIGNITGASATGTILRR